MMRRSNLGASGDDRAVLDFRLTLRRVGIICSWYVQL